MAIPFLSKLFIKEAEQVAFKPLPAALANLSASASAQASKAGTNIAKTAIKKGTDIMKTKVLIGSVAAVVVVGATVGYEADRDCNYRRKRHRWRCKRQSS